MATLTKLSYGGTAAVVTGMGVIVGFDAATASKATLVGSLLLIAVADNLADSLAIHAYQESERLAAKQAFRSTVANFVTRFLVAASFLILVLALPSGRLTPAALAWGMALLGTLTYFVARDRGRHRREPGDWHMDSRSRRRVTEDENQAPMSGLHRLSGSTSTSKSLPSQRSASGQKK